MSRPAILRILVLLFVALLIPNGAQSRRGGNPAPCSRPPTAGHFIRAAKPPVLTGNPFLVRRAGVFDPTYPDAAVQRFGNMKTFLWYGFFASDPQVAPNNFTKPPEFESLLRQVENHGMVLQLGFEPVYVADDKTYGLNLGTLKAALDPPNRDELAAQIKQALDQGEDPLPQLTPRKCSFQALPEGSNEWVQLSADLNIFLVNVVKWGHYLGGKNRTIILRPLSEMNEETAGSWCLHKPGVTEVNTPENYVDVWLALVSLLKQGGLKRAYYVFAPQAVSTKEGMVDEVDTKVVHEIRWRDSKTIDAFGIDVYPNKELSLITFTDLVRPWLRIFRPRRLPLTVPEMGIDRPQFPKDSERAKWIRNSFHAARQLGFVNVNYYHEGAAFTLQSGEGAQKAVEQGLAYFQAQ